jgi:hypothetical protein
MKVRVLQRAPELGLADSPELPTSNEGILGSTSGEVALKRKQEIGTIFGSVVQRLVHTPDKGETRVQFPTEPPFR